MRQLFSMFPSGSPGLALLILRASVALALLSDGYRHQQVLPGWSLGAALLLSIALFAGYLTPLVAGMTLVFHGLIWIHHDLDSAGVAALIVLDAVALAVLGPGAYSIDSRLFGRRIVPPPV